MSETNYLVLYKFSLQPEDQSTSYWTITKQFIADTQLPKTIYVENTKPTPPRYKHSVFTQSTNDS
jgi:hypothetical protein